MKITWEVNDGYGLARPQTLNFHEGDWWGCETEAEAMSVVYEALDEALIELGYFFDEEEVREAWRALKEEDVEKVFKEESGEEQ